MSLNFNRKFNLFPFNEQHKLVRRTIEEFVAAEVEPQAEEYDREEKFNLDLFKKLGEPGFLGVTVPVENGGAGMGAVEAVIVHEELSTSDPGFCLAFLAHAMLCVNNLAVNGSEEQKQKYLPKLCSGEWIGALGISEPHAGTDVLGMRTTAKRAGDHYILNGRKMWITNGTIDENKTPCDCVLIYARTGEDKNGRAEISTFLVEKEFEGFTVGQKISNKTGMRASNTAELCFDNCKIPASNLIGDEGDSIGHMMRNLEIERLTLAAMALGIARRSLDTMIKYAIDRTAFGKKLYQFGQIQRYIGDSFSEYLAASSFIYQIAGGMDLNAGGHRLSSDATKLFAAPIAKKVADRAMQVLGGYGYVGEYVVERLWRDAKLLEIGGGTLESHQKNITGDLIKLYS